MSFYLLPMMQVKEFTYKKENYKAFLYKNTKQWGWFVCLKLPILLQKGEHKTHNKAYYINLTPTDHKDIDKYIEQIKDENII